MSTPGTLEDATEQRDAARAYRGKDGMGATIGECDWEAEMSIIREEKQGENLSSVLGLGRLEGRDVERLERS